MPSILRNNSRFRRDQRQPAEEEEMWFNEEDDFDDVPTDTKIAPDLDNSISKFRICQKTTGITSRQHYPNFCMGSFAKDIFRVESCFE
jgi:hypothetical protein